jgi:hypothetical protein
VAVLLPTINHLTERQHQLFFLFQGVIVRHKPEGFSRLIDEDVAQAAAAVASTLETAARGVLYEHTPASLPAQRLARDMTAALADLRAKGPKVYDGEAAIALRAIEHGAREVHRAPGADDASYLTLIGRLIQVSPRSAEETVEGSALIVP